MEMEYSEDAGFFLEGTSVEVEVANSHEVQNVELDVLALLPSDVEYNEQLTEETENSFASFPSDVEFLEEESTSSQQIDEEEATVGNYSFLASLESYLDTAPQDVRILEDESASEDKDDNRVIEEPTHPEIIYNFAWTMDPFYVVNDRGHFNVRGREHQVGADVSYADLAIELEAAAWVSGVTDNYDAEE